jgi:hypothetical protein
MNLGDGHVDRGEGVCDRDRGVCERSRIDHQPATVEPRLVDRVDEHALVIALHCAHLEPELPGGRGGKLLDVLECGDPVQRELAAAEQVQVRAVDEKQRLAIGRHARGAARRTGALSMP